MTNSLKAVGEPVVSMAAVTANDSTIISRQSAYPNALYVGVGGNVVITDVNGSDVTLSNVAGGVWHRFAYQKVKSTGTTATNMVAGWA